MQLILVTYESNESAHVWLFSSCKSYVRLACFLFLIYYKYFVFPLNIIHSIFYLKEVK